MKNEIFIETDKQFTLNTYLPIASHTMSLIAKAAQGINEIDGTFSIDDVLILLNRANTYMSGEFEIRQTSSSHYHIVYKPYPYSEEEFEEEYILDNHVEAHKQNKKLLWVSEKVLTAFLDRKLYGVALMIYFSLGYLMTRDDALSLSHEISFEKILECCKEFPDDCTIKYRTTIMRALADLQDAGLIKWNAESRTFELLYITSYDPNKKV